MKHIGLKLLLLIMVVLCSACGILIVQPDQVAVVYNTVSGELRTPLPAGTHFLGLFDNAILYPIAVQQYTMAGSPEEGAVNPDDSIEARTSDGQRIWIELTLLFHVNPDQVNTLFIRWEQRYDSDFIRPTARALVREIAAQYSGADLYGTNRLAFKAALEDDLRERMAEEGFILDDVLIRNVRFTPEFAGTMEAQAIATQNAHP